MPALRLDETDQRAFGICLIGGQQPGAGAGVWDDTGARLRLLLCGTEASALAAGFGVVACCARGRAHSGGLQASASRGEISVKLVTAQSG